MTNKNKNKEQQKKGFRLNITLQNIIIIILLISYVAVFYAYTHDIDQYKNAINQCNDLLKNPQQLCDAYNSYLIGKNQQSSVSETAKENFSEIMGDMFISEDDE